MAELKLNIGCGTDYRDGFINIDGSNQLPRVDRVIDIARERLTDHFETGKVGMILANDIVEHHFHWEAIALFEQFHVLLRPGGILEMRVPDCRAILRSWRIPVERKLVLLYGGQDVPQGVDAQMDESRSKNPQYFCHKYGWTMQRMHKDLVAVGFQQLTFQRAQTNFIVRAVR